MGSGYFPTSIINLKRVHIPHRFILSVQGHIEEALKRSYVDGIMFSDMGHGHFLIPEERFEEAYKDLNLREAHTMYLSDPEIRVLYHTAENIRAARHFEKRYIVYDDPYLGWRYYTRNLVADNIPGRRMEIHLHKDSSSYNTLVSVPGYHKMYSFNLSANKSACFPFRVEGKTYSFDLSFEDVYDPVEFQLDFGYGS